MSELSGLLSRKTTWLGLSMIALACYRAAVDRQSWEDAIPIIFGGLGLIFVRDAILTNQRATEHAIQQIDAHEKAATVRAGLRPPAVPAPAGPEGLPDRLDRLRPDERQRLAALEEETACLSGRADAAEAELTVFRQLVAEQGGTLAATANDVRALQRDLRAVAGVFQAIRTTFHTIALTLKAARLERQERIMSEQFNQLQDALAGNEAKFVELQNAIATEGAQINAELEALRNQVAPNLQPAIDRVLASTQNLQSAINQVASFIPDVNPNPEPEPIPEPEPVPAPEPAPQRRR